MEQSNRNDRAHKSASNLLDVRPRASLGANETYQLINMNDTKCDLEKVSFKGSQSSNISPNPGPRTSNFRKKSMVLLNTLRNTTLSASKILYFKALSDETDQSPENKPIDLEAHIIYEDKKKSKNRIARKFLKRSEREEEDSDDDGYPATVLEKALDDDDDDVDEEDDDEEEEDDDVDNDKSIAASGRKYYHNNVIDCDDNDVMVDMIDGNKMDHELRKAGNMNLEVNQCYNFDEEENEGTYEDTAFEAAGCYEDDLTKYDQRHTRLSKLLTDNTDTLDDMQSIDNGILVDYEHLASMAKTHGDKTESDHNNNTASKSAGISRKISSQSISRLEYGAGGANAKIKYSQNFCGNSIYTNVNYLKLNDDCEQSSNLNKQQQRQAICKVTESKPQTAAAQGSTPSIIKLATYSTNNNNQVVATTTATTTSVPTGGKRQSVCFSDDILVSKNMDGKLTSPTVSSGVTTSQRNFGEDDKLEKDYLSRAVQLSPNGNDKLLTPYLSGSQLTGSFISSNSAVTNSSLGLNTSLRVNKSMTTGSKAMRIMGSNNATALGNTEAISKGSLASKKSQKSGNQSIKKHQQRRLFFKNGNINISRSNINKRRRRYLTDIFTTLIDFKWRYNVLVFAFGFIVSWFSFATAWYLIALWNGDLDPDRPADHIRCVKGIENFVSAILFSIETQQTIGYGARYTTERCTLAIVVMMIQSSIGVIIQSFMVGVVFAKLSRPKKRSETLMFSKNAVISMRDGRLCLICRVGDMRKSHIVEAHVRMYLIKKKVTQEGEILPLHMYDLNVGWDKGMDRLFLVWPLTIEHYIDEDSPFWNISADDLKKERFELAVILEGIVESTGMTTQARSSYLCNEILWGHRFEKLITFQKEDGAYKIDYSRFNMTIPIDTPTCSAKDLTEFKEQEQYCMGAYNDSVVLASRPQVQLPRVLSFNNEHRHSDLRRRQRVESKTDSGTNETEHGTTTMPSLAETEHSKLLPNEAIPEIVISK